MAPVVVHIGFPKCASTLLQRYVFPKMVGAQYVPFKDNDELYRALAWREFSGGNDARLRVLDGLKRAADASSVPLLLSAEHFVMPADCLAMSFPRPMPLLDSPEILSLLERTLGDRLRILMLVRRQEDWLESWYQERVKRYETRGFNEMLRASDFGPILDLMQYDKVVESLVRRFGEHNVTVLPFELLKSDPAQMWRAICGAVGCTLPELHPPIAKGRMQSQAVVVRRNANKLLVAIARLTGGGTALDDACFRVVKRVHAYDFLLKSLKPWNAYGAIPRERRDEFSSSNDQLGRFVNYDLKSLGYS